jgi:hypothetical protein
MSDIIDIVVQETIDLVDITVNPNIIEVNVTRTSGGGNQTLAQTLVLGNTTGGENIVINDADAIELENTSLLKKGTYDFGGDGGISRICSVDFEDMWQAGIRHVFDQSGFIRHSTNCFDVVPDSSFDNTLRFKVDSLWTLDNGTTYKCTDASTGAAVWEIYNNFIPNLTQVVGQGDISIFIQPLLEDEVFTIPLAWQVSQSYVFGTPNIGTGGVFLDKTVLFSENATLRFCWGYQAEALDTLTPEPFEFTTDAVVYYNGAPITALTVAPTDLVMVKSGGFISGENIWILTVTNKSSIPNLTQVLTVGDKVFDGVSSDRTWQPADRLKYWQVQSGVQTLDDTVFPDNSLIEGVIQNDDINATVTFDFDGVTPFYLDQAISTVTLNVGDFFQLKHLYDGAWILTVTNKSTGGGVPYTGATQDVDLGEFGLLTGNIEFDNTPTNIPTTAGSMVWNDTDGTVDLKLKGGNVTLQIGQEQVIRVVNKTATNINLLEANYQAVRVTGAQGQRLKVDLAQATTDALSAETIGLVTETINNNQEGFITTSGLIRGINTTGSLQSETWADGDILYLSSTVAGRITKVKPTAPNHLVIVGYVIHAHATQGSIFVKVDNGYKLDELHNVKITTAANGQALTYTSATDIWENKTIIEDSITNGVTTVAPSQNAVFDALALKQDTLTETNFGNFINARTAKNTLVDADEVISDDSADSSKAKKTSWLNVWTNYLKVKADALYATIANLALKENIISGVVASGTDTYTATYSPTISYTDGLKILVRFANANTAAATINVNSLGAKSIVKGVSTALVAGDIPAGTTVLLAYDGTNFVIVGSQLVNQFVSWSPTYGGFSVAPSGGNNRYCLQDKLCNFYLMPTTDGTSNASTLTFTLPFVAKNQQVMPVTTTVNNGTVTVGGIGLTSAGSNVMTIAPFNLGVFTSSGAKRVVIQGFYEIQ